LKHTKKKRNFWSIKFKRLRWHLQFCSILSNYFLTLCQKSNVKFSFQAFKFVTLDICIIFCQVNKHFYNSIQFEMKSKKTFNENLGANREHWTGEVSADERVPVFPVFNWPLVLWKKYFVLIKRTYSSRYSFVACNSRYA